MSALDAASAKVGSCHVFVPPTTPPARHTPASPVIAHRAVLVRHACSYDLSHWTGGVARRLALANRPMTFAEIVAAAGSRVVARYAVLQLAAVGAVEIAGDTIALVDATIVSPVDHGLAS